jgi:protein-tyrosine phosphatase
MINVLFVCLGNICRSPMAEAVFKDLVTKAGLSAQFNIDSVGTSDYHIGQPPHWGTQRILSSYGVPWEGAARQLTRAELRHTDYIIAMDRSNLADIQELGRGLSLEGRAFLLLNFAKGTKLQDVPDPYYNDNFEEVYHLVLDGCRGLLAHIRREKGL